MLVPETPDTDTHAHGIAHATSSILIPPSPRSRPGSPLAEFEYYVQTFTATGFTGGLNYYRNLDRSWERTAHLADTKVTQPSLFIAGSADPVIQFTPLAKMSAVLTDLRGSIILEGAGHWIQQQRPTEVNAALIDFAREVAN